MTKARLSSSAPASRSGRGTDRLRRPEHTLPFIEETTQHAGPSQNSKPNITANTKKEERPEIDRSIREDLALSKFSDLRCDDDPELSMLRSIAGDSSRSWDATPSRLARLREHEYEDQSDNEQATETVWKGYQEYINKPRALSAGARQSHVRDMESRLAGFRHEKMKSSSSRESHDDRLDGLVYDSDFDCYYNPVTDQYYKLQPGS